MRFASVQPCFGREGGTCCTRPASRFPCTGFYLRMRSASRCFCLGREGGHSLLKAASHGAYFGCEVGNLHLWSHAYSQLDFGYHHLILGGGLIFPTFPWLLSEERSLHVGLCAFGDGPRSFELGGIVIDPRVEECIPHQS